MWYCDRTNYGKTESGGAGGTQTDPYWSGSKYVTDITDRAYPGTGLERQAESGSHSPWF